MALLRPIQMTIKSRLFGKVIPARLGRTRGVHVELRVSNEEMLVQCQR